MDHQQKRIPYGVLFLLYINFGDSNSERARSVKKSCLWQVFSERVAQSGTVRLRLTVDKQGWMRSRHISDGSPTETLETTVF